MPKQIILCVDDEVMILNALKAELKNIFLGDYLIEVTESGQDALDLIDELQASNYAIPLVISDYLMPEMKGDEVLQRIHQKLPNAIKIMLTGHATIEGVANAIKYAMLYRYIAKPWHHADFKLTVTEALHKYLQDQNIAQKNAALTELNLQQAELIKQLHKKELHLQQLNERLQAALTAELKLKELSVEQQETNRQLMALSTTDALTNIPNRRRFDEFLALEWQRVLCEGQSIALAMLDVDFFKKYNDHYGHQAGDECLRKIAAVLKETISNEDHLVARYGGEEFAFLCPSTSLERVLSLAKSICENVENLNLEHELSTLKTVTVSIGVAIVSPHPHQKSAALVKSADDALYLAKSQGRNQVVLA
jgi:diguanylate cyclase (GGDEF)-like protein